MENFETLITRFKQNSRDTFVEKENKLSNFLKIGLHSSSGKAFNMQLSQPHKKLFKA